MIKEIFEVSAIAAPRTKFEVLSKLMEEVGELAQEVGIAEGYQKRQPGKDGIIGECADVLNCTVDLIFLTDPEMTEEKFMEIMQLKLNKWKSYCSTK